MPSLLNQRGKKPLCERNVTKYLTSGPVLGKIYLEMLTLESQMGSLENVLRKEFCCDLTELSSYNLGHMVTFISLSAKGKCRR
jgi:hypothetical protein